MTTRAAVYVRISRDPEGLRAGVDRQERDCREMCDRRGWEVGEVYADNDTSAYSGKPRKAYDRMLADIAAARVGAIVTWHNDRLHRSPKELEAFIDLVERSGVTLAVVTGGDYDLTTPDGRLAARIVGAVARKESEDKSRRLRRKHLELAEQGLSSGGRRPFGYGDEHEAALVREAADRVLNEGHSLRSIAGDWNRRGYTTTTGGAWTTVAVKRILTAPRIAGLRIHKRPEKGGPPGKLYPATWPAIVDRETFDQLRLVLTDPKRTTNGGVTHRSYLLAGVARCGACGGKLYARPRADKSRCYVCISPPNFTGCGKIRRLAEPVEALVRDAVLAALDSGELRDAMKAAGGDDPAMRAAAVALGQAEERLGQLEEARFVTGELPEATYKRLRAALEREIDRLRADLDSYSQGRALAGLPAGQAALRERWDAADVEWQRELVRAVVERVVILPARRGYNKFDPTKVEIEWRV